MSHSDKSEDPDFTGYQGHAHTKGTHKRHTNTHTHTHTHTPHEATSSELSALAQLQECIDWLQYTARLTAHMDSISAEADRRCCDDALMMPQNLLLGSAPNLMLFSSVPCLHNVLQYTRTVLSQQCVMLSACQERLLSTAGWPCPTSMQLGAGLQLFLAHRASQAYVCALFTWNIHQSHQGDFT